MDDRLTADERRALLLLLTSVALADGKLTDSEVQFIQRLALPVGVEVGELLAAVDDADHASLCARLQRPIAARIGVIELLRLAHVDDTYAHVEKDAIQELAAELRVGTATVERLEDWVHEEWLLLARGRRLIAEG